MKQSFLTSTTSKFILAILLVFGLSFTTKADIIRLVVKEDRASCTGVAPQTCYQVKYKNSKDWELFYSNIEGFKYKAGYRYVLQVIRTKRANVPADASAYTYKLKKILKKQKMPQHAGVWSFVTKHKWKLIQMNGLTQENSPAYIVFDKVKGRISGNAGCNGFFGAYEKGNEMIRFKQLGSTLMACPDEGRNKLEHDFMQLLSGNTFKYDVADQTLNLYQGERLVLMFGITDQDK
ncbi:DUF4377 domain-containing protein [Pedobacter nutrimenti]|uniref:Heat shock protein HslJ n=1 Tax=Pedobacter nutrimenti TaxID=1241337 RepID=A0A318UG27_9SPHI|nr:DUF4377 domain-containing protein [Pedobacter nutrimenti]PYF74440.1 heat shock protein HslJ [Pedobacter nutrimenti]